MIKKLLNKIAGDPNKKALKAINPIVEKINEIEAQYQQTITTKEQIQAKTTEFKDRIRNGESLEDLLPEAFALVKTACRQLVGTKFDLMGNEQEWQMIPYDVQLIGGVVLHQGNITEMKTGEGKTLVCTMPVYLNALEEKGVFVVTVNDYLAERDSQWMGVLYEYLGLTVGVTLHGQSPEEKQNAYAKDITYGTNNEFGFDYLRDNMAVKMENVVQKQLHYAIVDEVDSILIDEARTPLIISAPAQESTQKYRTYTNLINQLEEGTHYDIDEKGKTASLTEEGIAKMEQLLGVENIYTERGFSEVHHLEQALRAKACYKADKDYLVKDGQIIIIDEFTGRMMPGRRYSGGLHQALEAKENVEIKRQSRTLATITFQNYFRMFDKLAGMTGTAATEAEEFYQIYGLEVIEIPTNKPVARLDREDAIYKNQDNKYKAVVRKVNELHQKGQPVLVGTVSVEHSEMLSRMLQKAGIPHNVLNAKNHAKEAEIVARAGQKGAVTIATNMAGRGTDIKLGKEVKDLGGLFILGTERHEARRIDNQLRGRSGRQGDPGESQFFVSMEDALMRMFGGERIQGMMEMLKVPEDVPIENRMISRSIEGAQKKVEGRNFDIRKHLVEYDDTMNIHREVIYKRRRAYLEKEDISEDVEKMIKEYAEALVRNHTDARKPEDWDYKEIWEAVMAIHKDPSLPLAEVESFKDQDKLIEKIQQYLTRSYKEREKQLPDPKIMRAIEKAVALRANDVLWMEHIDEMTQLRENVAFSGYAQKDPLTEYKSQGYEKFTEMLAAIQSNTVNTLFKVDTDKIIPVKAEQGQAVKPNLAENPKATQPTVTKSTFDAQPKPSGEVKKTKATKVIKISGAPEVEPAHPAQDLQYSSSTTKPDPAPSGPKVGRNDPCPCGSGKKYKKCCGKNV